ncbi:MAG: hypothetical protein ACD_73C00695G0002 [uncultured bacterium]|nr:MAG: hypothetical protein ACD_73C00695G0002 [uncultured bacterium]
MDPPNESEDDILVIDIILLVLAEVYKYDN